MDVTDGKNKQEKERTTPLTTPPPVTIKVTDVDEPPDAPDAPTVSKNSTTPKTKLDVSWTAPSTSGRPDIDDYDVQYKLSNTNNDWTSHSFTGTGTSTTLTGLTSGKSYDVQVRAVNDEGNGGWSDSGSAITHADDRNPRVSLKTRRREPVSATPVTATSNPSNYTYSYTLRRNGR